jgi:hypothetical protein
MPVALLERVAIVSASSTAGVVAGGGLSLAQRFAKLFTVSDWRFRASLYASSGANVTAFVDLIDPAHLKTVAAGTIALPTAESTLNGALAATFGGTEWCDSNRASSAWKYCHDGTDNEEYHVFTPTLVTAGVRNIAATCRGDVLAGDIGFEIQLSGANGLYANINNTATPLLLLPGAVATVNVGICLAYRGGTAQSTDGTFMKGTTTVSAANYGSAVSSANPTGTRRLGAGVDGLRPARMRWTTSFGFRRVLTTNERALVRTYLRFFYGTGIAA